jgi:DNA-binding MarR family transcriptional regulator
MDAVMFEMKAAHLAVQNVGRKRLRPYGLTPARFDLMNALGRKGLKQSDLWKRLNVVRSVISEMVRALEALAWVKRVRAADGRTWLVMLTQRGRAIFKSAFDDCLESGNIAVEMDFGLTDGRAEADAMNRRNEFLHSCTALARMFRTQPRFRRRRGSLYTWEAEDYWFWLIEPGDPPGKVPFVT